MDLPAGSKVRKYVEIIEEASLMATDLAKQMLAYSGKGSFVVKPIDLRSLIEDMASLLKTSISKNSELVFDFEELVPSISADETQIQQVIMNLVINASEAIGDADGTILIRTGKMQCDRVQQMPNKPGKAQELLFHSVTLLVLVQNRKEKQ